MEQNLFDVPKELDAITSFNIVFQGLSQAQKAGMFSFKDSTLIFKALCTLNRMIRESSGSGVVMNDNGNILEGSLDLSENMTVK